MAKKRLSSAEKFAQLKKQTESAGMRVSVRGSKVVVGRRKKK